MGDGRNEEPRAEQSLLEDEAGPGSAREEVREKQDRRGELSRASYRKMQENLVWAAGYNVFAIPLAAGVLAPVGVVLSPAVGALLMSLSTVIVAVNAQFLRRADVDLPSLSDASSTGRPRPAD